MDKVVEKLLVFASSEMRFVEVETKDLRALLAKFQPSPDADDRDPSLLTDCRSAPRRPLNDPDLTHDWTPQHYPSGAIGGYYCPDCLIAGAPTSTLCPDRVGALIAEVRRLTDALEAARLDLDPAAVVGSAPIPSPAPGCTACPNFVAEGGNAGGWRCRAVDDSIVVGLWIDEATGATNGYMPDGSAGEVPSDARTCPAFGKPAAVGSGS